MDNNVLNQIINNFDYAYILIVNIVTYFFIKIVDYFNGDKIVSINIKRILTIIAIIIMFVIYYFMGYQNKIILINSSIAAPVIWSWLLRPLFVKLNIGYKQNDNNKE